MLGGMGQPSDKDFPPLESDDEEEPTTQQTGPPTMRRGSRETLEHLPTELEDSHPSFDEDDEDAPTVRSDPRVTANERPRTELDPKGKLADEEKSDDTAVDEAVVSMPDDD